MGLGALGSSPPMLDISWHWHCAGLVSSHLRWLVTLFLLLIWANFHQQLGRGPWEGQVRDVFLKTNAFSTLRCNNKIWLLSGDDFFLLLHLIFINWNVNLVVCVWWPTYWTASFIECLFRLLPCALKNGQSTNIIPHYTNCSGNVSAGLWICIFKLS